MTINDPTTTTNNTNIKSQTKRNQKNNPIKNKKPKSQNIGKNDETPKSKKVTPKSQSQTNSNANPNINPNLSRKSKFTPNLSINFGSKTKTRMSNSINFNISNRNKNINNINTNQNRNLNSKIHIKHTSLKTINIPKPPERNVSKSIGTVLSGGFAGMIAKTCTAPLERVQMLNQTGATQSSIHRTLQTIFMEDGISGLWRGNFANCIRVFPHKSILFAANDSIRSMLPHKYGNVSSINFLTGAIAGALATTATYPIDLIRAYLAGTFDKQSKSMLSVARIVIKNQGFFGLYTGLGVTLVGAVPYEAFRIGVYNVIRHKLPTVPTKYGNEPHPIGKLLGGACAGACAGIVTYPTDTLRRMLQVQNASGMPVYSGVFDCIQKNMKKKGIRRFYRGLPAKLVRVIPDAAILFLAYEQLKDYFDDVYYKSQQSNDPTEEE